MNIFAAIVLGILIGWLIEWVIDWLFWRKRGRAGQSANADCQKQIAELERRNRDLQEEINSLKSNDEKILRAPLPDDDLTEIKGIGPKISALLQAAGIRNFTDLGNLTPDGLRELVGDVIERLADEDKIISQARELAEKRSQGK